MAKSVVALVLALLLGGMSNARSNPPDEKQSVARERTDKQGLSNADAAQNLSTSIDQVICWLPENTETLSVVRGPFDIGPRLLEPPANISAQEYVELGLRSVSLSVLGTIGNGQFYKPLIGRSVSFCVEGSRRFREPKSLGGMLYEGCHIIVLQHSLGTARDSLVRQMASAAKRIQRIAGHQVMMFEEKLEEDTWTIFVAIPSPNVLLCAVNEDFLTQVLTRMQRKAERRALPQDLPEWKYVNTNAKFWAVRHYNIADALNDPTSPLSKEQSASWVDNRAIGIVFDLDPDRSKAARIRYLSANENALKLFADLHKDVGPEFKPVIQQNGAGPVEMLVSLDDLAEVGMFLFVLFTLFGHAIYV